MWHVPVKFVVSVLYKMQNILWLQLLQISNFLLFIFRDSKENIFEFWGVALDKTAIWIVTFGLRKLLL